MLRVEVGEGGAATDAGGAAVCTNVPAHIVKFMIGTLCSVVTGGVTLGISGV